MSNSIPADLRFTKSHEWLRQHADGTLVFVEVPAADKTLAAGDACAVVESVKAASDVYAPIAGTVVEGNPALEGQPELINTDPYGAGWIAKLRPANAADLAGLMDAAAYEAYLAAEA